MNRMFNVMILILTVLIVLTCGPLPGEATAQFQITAPRSNSVVLGEVVEVSGVGADPAGTIEVDVLTNDWYLQEGKARINSDGTWSFSPVHLAGKGTYNNHTIKATIVKGGHRMNSVTVSGIVRRQ